MEPNQVKAVLWANFSGQATPLQKQLLADWLREEGNVERYYQALHEWEKEYPQLLPDTTADWQQFLTRINPEPAQKPPVDEQAAELPTAIDPGRLWLVAASVALLVLVGWWQREALLYQTYTTAFGETRPLTLPDGSRVVLNANSTLRFPRFLSLLPTREARLWGEAEFSVVHTVDDRPFVVHTPDQLEVRVLGTEFIVYSRERGSKVVLNRGKVALHSLKTAQKPLAIRPGDVVTVDARGTFQRRSAQPVADHAAWKEHRFVFNRTPLRDIAEQIQERFGVEVLIPDATLAALQVSGNYPAQTADEVLSMLTQLLNLRAERREQVIVLQSQN
ncbi:FecR family protein [Larkinella sp. VNQ87]|uniref:FecR family protein n=1 Tax=Larkinella sp. VNQ87 TaxID=3400921 RepID=UPI003BFAE366